MFYECCLSMAFWEIPGFALSGSFFWSSDTLCTVWRWWLTETSINLLIGYLGMHWFGTARYGTRGFWILSLYNYDV